MFDRVILDGIDSNVTSERTYKERKVINMAKKKAAKKSVKKAMKKPASKKKKATKKKK